MSLNQLCSNNNNKFLPEVYLADLKTDGAVFQNSNIVAYNPSSLNCFEEVILTPTWSNFTNPSQGTGKVKLTRINNNVYLSFDRYIGDIGVNPVVSNAFIPARFRPSVHGFDAVIIIQTGGTVQAGVMRITTSGTIQVYPTTNTASPNWASASNSGWINGGSVYSVDTF